MNKPINRVPNLAPTTTDKILRERAELEEAAPSAPLIETPDGTKLLKSAATAGARVSYDKVEVNDLAAASGIVADPYKLKLEADKRHVTEKIYMNSEAFNELRRELYEYHREVFDVVGGYMIADPFIFVTRMNTLLGMSVQFDSWNEAGICQQFLDELRKQRGAAWIITNH